MLSSSLRDLRERKAAKVSEMTTLHEASVSEDRSFSDDEQARWDSLEKEISVIDEQYDRQSKLDTDAENREEDDREIESRSKEEWRINRRSHSESDNDPNRPLTQFEKSLILSTWVGNQRQFALRERGLELCKRAGVNPFGPEITIDLDRPDGIVPRTIEEARQQSRERRERRDEQSDSLERRAQSVGTTTAGGHTAPDSMMGPLEIALLQWGSMRAVADVMQTASGTDMPWPTVNDTAQTGEIIAENAAVNEQDVTFGQVVFQAYKYSSKMVRVSSELLQDSATNIPALLGRLLGERLGRITNAHFTTGTGSSQPNGIVTAANNSSTTTASNTALTWAEMLGVKHAVDPAYRAGAGWMMHDSTLKILKQMVDSQSRTLWQPSLVAGEPGTFDGDPIYINQDMPTGAGSKAVIYGDFSKYKIREVQGITLLRSDQRYIEYHQDAFLGFGRWDGDLLDAGTNPVAYLTLAS